MNRKLHHYKYLVACLSFLLLAMSADKPAYFLFNAKGKTVSYNDFLKDLKGADVVLFGELHNNPICHWLQIELTQDLYKEKGKNLVLGAEMFESDNQLLLDEYLGGKIKTKNFEDEAKLWPNYITDYKPLVEFAKKNAILFVATNIPRRYAAMVSKGGFEVLDSLQTAAKALLPPLPISYDPDLKGYKEMMSMEMGGGHVSPNFPKAQAVKDATMAWFIVKNLDRKKMMLHFNGTYHSENHEGIIWYLRKLKPSLKIISIASTEQDDIHELEEESRALADYILCTPASMTKTR